MDVKGEIRRRLLEELAWHTDHPAYMLTFVLEDEAADILKRGFITKELWLTLEARAQAEGN